MANSQGGVILLGVEEQDGVDFEIRAIRSNEFADQGFYAMFIFRSRLAPHGQRVNRSWRYYLVSPITGEGASASTR